MRLQEETGLFLRSFMYSPAVASVSLTVMLSQMKEKKNNFTVVPSSRK